jgi:hypothetical protein
MKLIHKVEECALYESGKCLSASESHSCIKSFLLKISSSTVDSESPLALLSTLKETIKHISSNTSTSIQFKAQQVAPLKNFIENLHSNAHQRGMAYTLTLKLLADIGTQLERIRAERGFIIPFLSLEDIVVIQTEYESAADSHYTFIFINAEKLLQEPGSVKKEFVVDVPLKVNTHTSFLPTELPESALKRLPMRLSTTSWQYSLSALCIYALLQHKFKNGEDDIERVGRPFLHTSLYFCLKRCLKLDPEERVLLYV